MLPRARPTRRRTLIMITLAVGLIVCGLTAPRVMAEQHSLDFTAGNVGQIFTVPEDMWSSINRFVFLICFDFASPEATHVEFATRFSKLTVYPQLLAACRQWGNETFEMLQTLATELAKGDVKDLLVRLQAAVQRLRQNPSAENQQGFAQHVEALQRRLTELSDLSGRVNQQFMQLYNLSTAAIQEYQRGNFPENRWVSIGPQLEGVQYAMGAMIGRWNALTSDVQHLRTFLTFNRPRLADLDIKVGLTSWEDVTPAAQAFVTNVPAQRKYLSGENYYEDCPLREEVWYVLKNQFLAEQGYVLTAQNTDLKMLPRSAAGNRFQEWQFRRLGRGWWHVVNRQHGEAAFLDVLNDGGKNYPPWMVSSTPGQYTGQWWRCLPTESPGWFRLFNSFLGELSSLDTYSDTHTAFMDITENRSGQYWRFEVISSP